MLTNYSGKRKKVKRRPRYFRALLGRGDGKIGRNRRKRTPEGFTSAKNGYNIRESATKKGAVGSKRLLTAAPSFRNVNR